MLWVSLSVTTWMGDCLQTGKQSWFNAGPLRATAWPGETFLRGPKHFHGGPSGEKIFLFKMVHSGILYIFGQQWSPLNVVGPRVVYPPRHPLDRPGLMPENLLHLNTSYSHQDQLSLSPVQGR